MGCRVLTKFITRLEKPVANRRHFQSLTVTRTEDKNQYVDSVVLSKRLQHGMLSSSTRHISSTCSMRANASDVQQDNSTHFGFKTVREDEKEDKGRLSKLKNGGN